MILADLLEENDLEIEYDDKGCRSETIFDHTDIKVDNNGNVISILLSSFTYTLVKKNILFLWFWT